MVKSIIYTLTALALCIALFIFCDIFLHRELGDFYMACDQLYDKLDEGTATSADAQSVKLMWENTRRNLHIFIPHNDVAPVDSALSELCGLIYAGEYDLALGKAEILKTSAKNLPDAYSLRLENIF